MMDRSLKSQKVFAEGQEFQQNQNFKKKRWGENYDSCFLYSRFEVSVINKRVDYSMSTYRFTKPYLFIQILNMVF